MRAHPFQDPGLWIQRKRFAYSFIDQTTALPHIQREGIMIAVLQATVVPFCSIGEQAQSCNPT